MDMSMRISRRPSWQGINSFVKEMMEELEGYGSRWLHKERELIREYDQGYSRPGRHRKDEGEKMIDDGEEEVIERVE